jgi:hypothetical protein
VVAAAGGALSRLGRVFGAARVAALARAGAYRSSEHAPLLESLPFARWNRVERELAPPLVVRVEGPRLRLSGLADLLDGATKIAVLAPAAESPAPLALLVTPGVFVAQGNSIDVLERLRSSTAPGVAAILPAGAARFVHDPAGGERFADRWTVEEVPAAPAEHPRVGPDFRAAQERAQLALLIAAAAEVPTNGTARTERLRRDPAGLLAAWLLREASLARTVDAMPEAP